MASKVGSTSVYLLPGMSVQIKIPVDTRTSAGWFSGKEIPPGFFDDLPNADTTVIRGFAREDKEAGELKASPDDPAAVIYTHKRAVPNTIWFFPYSDPYGELSKERAIVNVIAVPIHDHSSIVQGGPAYGTYFSDDEEANT